VSTSNPARVAADHDLVFADWHGMTERIMSIMSAHLPVPSGTLVDATCATGMACDAAMRMGWEVIGVDSSLAMVERARERLPDITFHVGEVTELYDAVGTSVDAVISIGDGLPAVGREGIQQAIAEMRRCTRLGGAAMVVVRDFTALRSAVWRDDPVCKVTALFVTRHDHDVDFTLQVDDAEGTRTHTRVLHPVREHDLRTAMDASGYRIRRTGKMLGRLVVSGTAI
jgi:cyclopropane fatty-acyl-phospholipid synthase-like methyltransferase